MANPQICDRLNELTPKNGNIGPVANAFDRYCDYDDCDADLSEQMALLSRRLAFYGGPELSTASIDRLITQSTIIIEWMFENADSQINDSIEQTRLGKWGSMGDFLACTHDIIEKQYKLN
ncbi:unnamed protein product [Anisakis simplex]|uniref:Uncharacterized protein n=1 Tax=Anisakis simplex TaxID=6269 RepID=A0A3P6PDU5_ANISI|nr:unnamed protein product [Anisakis simplex]